MVLSAFNDGRSSFNSRRKGTFAVPMGSCVRIRCDEMETYRRGLVLLGLFDLLRRVIIPGAAAADLAIGV